MAENVKYKFIQNVGDYFPSGYFSEDFIDKVQKASGLNSDQMTELCKPYVKLRGEYEKYKNYITPSCSISWATILPAPTSSSSPSTRTTIPWFPCATSLPATARPRCS